MKNAYFRKLMPGMFLPLMLLVVSSGIFAQQTPAPVLPDTSKMTYNQISQQAKLYVYPSKGQSKQKQKEDEFECYKWAVEQSGIDPLNLPKKDTVVVQSGPTGAGVKGAAKGAAAGAAIGSISGDMGKGAAYGAMIGAAAGHRQGKQAQAQANQQAQEQSAAQEKAMKESFQKAFSVCIEGKGYTIK